MSDDNTQGTGAVEEPTSVPPTQEPETPAEPVTPETPAEPTETPAA